MIGNKIITKSEKQNENENVAMQREEKVMKY